MKLLHKILLVVAIGGASLSEANAVAITTLFNTGVNSSGTVLADGTVGDPHYTLTSVPSGPTDIRIKTSASGFPVGPWLGDDTASTWIGPNSGASLDGPAGSYTYRTTFDLTGLDPATASISGQWSTDDSGPSILLNGVLTPNLPAGGFSSFFPFSITSGFSTGVNTLDFAVVNGGGPTGLRVEMSGTASSARAVPDSGSTLLFFGSVIPALGTFRRRKN